MRNGEIRPISLLIIMKLIVYLFLSIIIFTTCACSAKREKTSEPPRVNRVYPTSDTLPANLLRMYVQFSKPMKTVGNLERIKLMNADGREVVGAIFNNVYELWNDKQTQLTLIFDPARVKTGLQAHDSLGRALSVGESYRLLIQGLEDVHHQPLDAPYTKVIHVAAPDTIPPNTEHWEMVIPTTNSLEPFIVQFPGQLDQLSLKTRLILTKVDKEQVEGIVKLGVLEKSWQFFPAHSWVPGTYLLFINSRLEDPAGNNLNGLFDHKTGSLKHEKEGEIFHLRFQIEG